MVFHPQIVYQTLSNGVYTEISSLSAIRFQLCQLIVFVFVIFQKTGYVVDLSLKTANLPECWLRKPQDVKIQVIILVSCHQTLKSRNHNPVQIFMKQFLVKVLIPVLAVLMIIPSLRAESDILRLKNAIRQFRPFKCKFEQEYYDAFQEKKVVASGTLYFMQPGLMKWLYEQPEEMVFVIGREKVWLYDPVLENVTVQQISEVSGIRSLRFLSEEEDISAHFKEISPQVDFLDHKSGLTTIYLAPKEASPTLLELQLSCSLKENQIHQFVIIDHNSNYRKITLTEISIMPELKESEFEFEITGNMEVIQGIGN